MSRERQPDRRRVKAGQDAWTYRPRGRIIIPAFIAILAAAAAFIFTTSPFGARPHLTADTPSGPLFGMTASDPGQLSAATAMLGHLPVIRVYYPGLPKPNAWTTGAPGINKSAAIISFNAPPSQILSGAGDRALNAFFSGAPSSYPIYYSYYPEPEQYIEDGKFTATAYREAWKHIVTLADKAGNPELKATLVLTNWDLSSMSGRNWKNYLPSGNTIAVLGWDAYPAGTVHNVDPQVTPPEQFMGPEVAASRSVGLPFGFAEFGLGRTDGRPAWLAQVANYLVNEGALFGTYFQSAGWPQIELKDAASIAEYRSIVHSHQGSPVSAPPTAPAPVRLAVTGLSVAKVGGGRVAVSFTLTKAANVTICLLNSHGTLVARIARPDHKKGLVRLTYAGPGSATSAAGNGRYKVLVVAANTYRSATAERPLRVSS